jgi:hypothetical protein
LLAAVLVLVSVARVSTAGFSAQTGTAGAWESGRVALTDDDADTALFSTATAGLLDGGQSQTRCLEVTYTGTFTQDLSVRVHATAAGGLAPYLTFTVEEGTGGGAGTCAGFTPAATLYTGTLAGFASVHRNFTTGAGDWEPTASGQRRTYRFISTVQNHAAAQLSAATATFTFEINSLGPFTPALLSGKALWLRAKTVTGATGDPVATWADQSGSGQNATAPGTTPTLLRAATPSGGPAVAFDAGGFRTHSLGMATYSATHSNALPSSPSSKAVDANLSTAWIGASLPTAMTITPRQPYPATGYAITAPNTAGPRDFTFEGTNDNGTTWTVLDTQTGRAWVANTPQTFTFSNTTTYSTYRLRVTGVTGTTQVQIAEMTLVNNPTPGSTSGEVWIVTRARTPYGNGSWTLGTTGPSRYTDGTRVNDSFGSNQYFSFVPKVPVTSWRIYRVTANTSTWAAYLDGTLQNSFPTGTRYWPDQGEIGQSGASSYRGDIAEVLLRDRVSTAKEAAKITAYLNAEHGLTSS